MSGPSTDPPAGARVPASPLAVALAYRTGETAPRVVARGRGALAETIIERAREAGVYVHESPELVALLAQVDLDQRIPPQLYVAVAELLAWLYRLERGEQPPPLAPPGGLPETLRAPPGARPADRPRAAAPSSRSTGGDR
jgi:flagellar biosynthesis protein